MGGKRKIGSSISVEERKRHDREKGQENNKIPLRPGRKWATGRPELKGEKPNGLRHGTVGSCAKRGGTGKGRMSGDCNTEQ